MPESTFCQQHTDCFYKEALALESKKNTHLLKVMCKCHESLQIWFHLTIRLQPHIIQQLDDIVLLFILFLILRTSSLCSAQHRVAERD